MKDSIKIYPRGIAYLGKRSEKEGYNGPCERMFNAVTQTIIKPGATLEEVKRSLELTLQDLELRIEHEGRMKRSAPNKKQT